VVRLGNIFSRFPYDDLLATARKEDATQTKRPAHRRTQSFASGDPVPVTIQTAHNTIDLRGKRVDEALIFMENELDRMVRNSVFSAVIIHGHGTGAVKEAVRKCLKGSPYVVKFRAGEQSEGGDGVSIALLNG
jgi:DNA mismatch repair protein MutS2